LRDEIVYYTDFEIHEDPSTVVLDPVGAGTCSTFILTTNSYTFTGLPNGTYEWQIRSKCADNTGTSYSDSAPPSFTILSCSADLPTNNTAINVDIESATLSWNTTVNIGYYNIRYREFGTLTWQSVNNITNQTYTLNGLSDETTYEWQIEKACGSGASSGWSSGVYFTTNVLPVADSSSCTQGNNITDFATIVLFSDEQAANPALNIIDGDPTSRWSAQNFPQEVVIDLGLEYSVDQINLYPYLDRDYQFIVEGSTTSSSSGFSTMIDASNNTIAATVINETFAPQVVRYVKLTVTGAATYTGTWSSINELEVICSGLSVPACTISSPINLSVDSIGESSVKLSWDDVPEPDLEDYKLRFREVGTTDWLYLSATSNNYVTINNLTPDATYEWQIKSRCANGNATDYLDAIGNNFTVYPVIEIQLALWLEGAYESTTSEMNTKLHNRGLLPGQTPFSILATPTPDGQPYNTSPWNYMGTEGLGWTDTDYTGDETDWVLVSFRTDIAKNTEVAMAAGLLTKNGTIRFPNRDILLSSAPDSLYIIVEHRNHMGIMTPAAIGVNNGVLAYDFRLSDSYRDPTSFGQKQLSTGEWSMYAGDADQSDFPSYDIQGTDKTVWFDNNGVFDYYLSPDFNLDGDVNGQDKAIWFSNNGISSRVPR